jgi:hypothetical protein
MVVDAENGRWLVPPNEAVWVPPGVSHGFRMLSDVATRSVYFHPKAVYGFPTTCRVIGVSPFLRELLIEAARLPLKICENSRGG